MLKCLTYEFEHITFLNQILNNKVNTKIYSLRNILKGHKNCTFSGEKLIDRLFRLD